jgi:condensin complex subunit 1
MTNKLFGAKSAAKKKQQPPAKNNAKRKQAADSDIDDDDEEENMDVDDSQHTDDATDHQQYLHTMLLHRNAVRMYVWLLQWLVSVEEIALIKKGSAALPEKGRKSKKAKLEEDKSSFWEDENLRERFLTTLLHVLDVDLNRLWAGLNPEETFISLFSKLVFQMLENAANAKCKPIKSAMLLIVAALVKKYAQAFAVVNIMIDLLVRRCDCCWIDHPEADDIICKQHKFEHVVGTLTDLVESVVKDTGAETLVNELMREVGKISYKELAHNNTAAKNLAGFIADIADRLPKLVLPNVALLMSHFEGEVRCYVSRTSYCPFVYVLTVLLRGLQSHTMRSGVIQVLGFLIDKAFASAATDATGDAAVNAVATARTRDSLLDVLLQRFKDITSFTRSKVCQTWVYLAQYVTDSFIMNIVIVVIRITDHRPLAFVQKTSNPVEAVSSCHGRSR